MKDKESQLYIVLVIISLVLLFVVLRKVRAGPPSQITFAAGPTEGAYYKFAQEYKALLASKGLQVNILETGGSVENLQLLEEGKADIGFVQSGLSREESKLESLGNVFPEPLWVFAKTKKTPTKLTEFVGKSVAIGSKDSGTREVAMAILEDAKMSQQIKALSMGENEARQSLLQGKIEAAFFVGSPSVDYIRELAFHPEIRMASFDRVEAYARFHASLFPVTLYAGMLDLSKDIPPRNIKLLSTASSLVVKEDFHYALVTLFLQAATKIHQEPGAFQTHGEYPSPKNVSLPLRPEAEKFYASGPSFFFRHLPFFWAATVDRLIILLLPLLTLLFPLFRVAPPLYGWILRRRLLNKQETLTEVELNTKDLSSSERQAILDELQAELLELKNLPPSYQNDVFLYQLRLERVQKALQDED